MSSIIQDDHKAAAGRLKNVLATYQDAEDLINIGAYKNGSNEEIDYAISKIKEVNAFLMQDVDQKLGWEEEIVSLMEIFKE
jgi:flagellum-specific ATP synthase